MKHLVNLLRALADENRLRALFALERGELCACQLVELLRLAPSTVSQHMNILKRAGLVAAEKRGRWMYYRRTGREAGPAASRALSLVRAGLREAPSIRRDRERLAAILRRNPQEICRRQARRGGARGGAGQGKSRETNDPHSAL